jgi:hypothetical protein
MYVLVKKTVSTPTLPQVASATLLLDLEADTLSLSDGDPVSTWADQSGNGHDFTQTGNARPTKQTVSSYPAVVFDGVDDWMDGANFADNLDSFAVFTVAIPRAGIGNQAYYVAKSPDNNMGWFFDNHGSQFFWQDLIGDNYYFIYYDNLPNFDIKIVSCAEKLSATSGHIYINGDNTNELFFGNGTSIDFSNSANVTLGLLREGGQSFPSVDLLAVLIYQITDIANWATDRAAIISWLAARYGVTL